MSACARWGVASIVSLVGLVAGVVSLSACTTFDGLSADPDAGGPGTTSGGDGGPESCVGDSCPQGYSPVGAQCKQGSDCATKVCVDGLCNAASSTDGITNGTETDIDCGGADPTNAPKCAAGKACKVATDCVWAVCTNSVCEAHKPGRKDGDETDVDCGGTLSPGCDWNLGCLVDTDCTSKGCGADHKCLVGPSCKAEHGGTTCGTGEYADADKKHESCCKTIEVTGFTDPNQPGKKVYVDKYEITAGRMRTFVNEVAKVSPGNVPNIQTYMAAHRPTSRWNPGWENLLPQSNEDGNATYTVASPTVDPLYPGQDRFTALGSIATWHVNSGPQTVDTGLYFTLGADHFFPEYIADSTGNPPAPWPSTDYAAVHNLNCTNVADSYGYGTYWFDNATINQFSGGVGKAFPQDVMDEKALNCAPFGMFAAFCAWDGGQLITTDVFDFIAGGPWPLDATPPPAPTTVPPPPRLANGNTQCLGGINTFSDGTLACDGSAGYPFVYLFPDPAGTFDGSSRIAPPGRVPADAVAINAGDEPWMDMIGNLEEASLRPDGTFDYRGYGVGWSSITAHHLQESTPRMKAGAFGARCMRFK